MNSPEMQMTPMEWLLVGCRGVPIELVAVLNVSRCFDGTVVFRSHDVLVLEFGSDPALIDELLAKLPRNSLTHVWRSGRNRDDRDIAVVTLPLSNFRSTKTNDGAESSK